MARERPLNPRTVANKVKAVSASSARVPSGLTMNPERAARFFDPKTGETVTAKADWGQKCLRILKP